MFTKLIDHKRAEHAVLILSARQATVPAHRAWFLAEAAEVRHSIARIKRSTYTSFSSWPRCGHCHWPVRYDPSNDRWFMESDVQCWHPDGHLPSGNRS